MFEVVGEPVILRKVYFSLKKRKEKSTWCVDYCINYLKFGTGRPDFAKIKANAGEVYVETFYGTQALSFLLFFLIFFLIFPSLVVGPGRTKETTGQDTPNLSQI